MNAVTKVTVRSCPCPPVDQHEKPPAQSDLLASRLKDFPLGLRLNQDISDAEGISTTRKSRHATSVLGRHGRARKSCRRAW